LVHIYNKAIRDKIPEIIEASGKKYKIKTLTNDIFLIEIEKKLMEEVNEYYESKSPDELADILEVIFRIAELKGVSKADLEKILKNKKEKRGGFSKNLFLIETD